MVSTLSGHKADTAPLDRSEHAITAHLERARNDLVDLDALASRLRNYVDSMIGAGGDLRGHAVGKAENPNVPSPVIPPLVALLSVREQSRDAMSRISADLDRLSALV